jgi:GNAT superfamily N-acetyltransferase
VADSSVRPARIADAAAIAAIQHQVWSVEYQVLSTAPLQAPAADELGEIWIDAIRNASSARHRVLVAAAGDLVVGFAAVEPTDDLTDEIGSLHVAKDHRRQGHGSRLMAAIADTSMEMSVETMTTWVLEGDHPWAGLLNATGWALQGSRRVLDLYGDESVLLVQHQWQTSLVGAP